jgi:hypothetical protein
MQLLFEDTKLMKTLGLKMLTKYRTLGLVDPPVTLQVLGAYLGRGNTSSWFKRFIYHVANLEYRVKPLSYKRLSQISEITEN